MNVAIEVFGPAPWQCNAFKDGGPWYRAVTGWQLRCSHVNAADLLLDVTYETDVESARPQEHTVECAVVAITPTAQGFRVEARPLSGIVIASDTRFRRSDGTGR